ncbi:MAG: OmpA family protein [Chitinophagaceae bacterium]|nr:OmpA family protein [Chitinophagaceae bacterium]
MKPLYLLLACGLLSVQTTQAQLIKKLKEKVNKAVEESIDKKVDKEPKTSEKTTPETREKETVQPDNKSVASTSGPAKSQYKVYSKFDFVPGNTILYYDNFEKDNIGETPEGWMTTNMAEVVEIEGLEGKWATLEPKGGAVNIARSKKQSWGDNFTIEFDIFMEPGMEGQSEQLYIYLGNSGGKMVSDESLLNEINEGDAIELYFGINKKDGTMYELTSYRNVAVGKPGSKTKFSSERDIKVNFLRPLHMSFCVQGKRLRFWMNEKKYLDINSAINPDVIPNLLAFKGHYYTNSKFYVSNIRIAKDVPDTRAEFKDGKIVSNLLFYSGTANMKPESLGALYDISKVIKDASGTVKIVGHTDSDGDDALNMRLSKQRAETVKDLLVKEYGIDASKLTIDGLGETQPVADNKTPEGKAQNRRVEFIFKP